MKLQLKRALNVTTEFDKTNKHSKKYFTKKSFLKAAIKAIAAERGSVFCFKEKTR